MSRLWGVLLRFPIAAVVLYILFVAHLVCPVRSPSGVHFFGFFFFLRKLLEQKVVGCPGFLRMG